MRKYLKSPFILATLGGVGALAFDILWLSGELLTHFEIISIEFYVIWRLIVLSGLILSTLICFYGIKQYLVNGYTREEKRIELEHKFYKKNVKKARQMKKNKVICNID